MQNPHKDRFSHNPAQSQRQGQHQVLAPQLQKSLYVLQLPVLELSSLIVEEIEQNPLLEYAEEDFFSMARADFRPESRESDKEENDIKQFIENTIASEQSLHDHLIRQTRERFPTLKERKLAELVIGNLDEHGFLSSSLEELTIFENVSVKDLEPIVRVIQTFDPLGIGARNLQDSLLIQLKMKGKKDSLAYQIIEDHFERMLKNQLPEISKKLNISAHHIRQTIEQDILILNLHPGANFAHSQYKEMIHYITPDVMIEKKGDSLHIEIPLDKIPKVRFIPKYMSLMEDPSVSKETKDYIRDKIHRGEWLLKTLDERHKTLYRIVEQVVKKQKAFLMHSDGKLLSFMMKDVASILQLHESTIVRAVANKYVSCPRGIFPLRFFFSHGYDSDQVTTSAHTIKQLVKELIEKEDRAKPLSDETIVSLLKEEGFPCARRTVAKYRTSLGIPSTAKRRKH